MEESTKKKVFKGVMVALLITGLVIGASVFFNTLSCISIPKDIKIKGQTVLCESASISQVVAVQGKQAMDKAITLKYVEACIAETREDQCEDKYWDFVNNYIKELKSNMPYSSTLKDKDGNPLRENLQIDANMLNVITSKAENIRLDCRNNRKPG